MSRPASIPMQGIVIGLASLISRASFGRVHTGCVKNVFNDVPVPGTSALSLVMQRALSNTETRCVVHPE